VKINIQICAGGAAFRDAYTDEISPTAVSAVVHRVAVELCGRLELWRGFRSNFETETDTAAGFPIVDENGNRCGRVSVVFETDENGNGGV
jgi:hypothetical protein